MVPPPLGFGQATVPKGLRQDALNPMTSHSVGGRRSLLNEYLHAEGQGGRNGEG